MAVCGHNESFMFAGMKHSSRNCQISSSVLSRIRGFLSYFRIKLNNVDSIMFTLYSIITRRNAIFVKL